MSLVIKEEEASWKPHPIAKDVKIKPLLTKLNHGVDVTCMLVLVKKGLIVPEHIHAEQDDILYPIHGRGKMWIDGLGEFEITKGMLIKVLRGTKHKIYDVVEDLLLYDVFSPATI